MTVESRKIFARWSYPFPDGSESPTVFGQLELNEETGQFRAHLGDRLPGYDRGMPLSINAPDLLPVLHADTSEGRYTTAVNVFEHASENTNGHALWIYGPRLVLKGHRFLLEEELKASTAFIRFRYQDAWAGLAKWEIQHHPEDDRRTVTVAQLRSPTRHAEVEAAAVRLVDSSPSFYFSKNPIVMEQRTSFHVELKEPIPLSDLWEEWVVPLGLWIGSGVRQPPGVRQMGVMNPAWYADHPEGRDRRWFTMWGPSASREPAEEGELHFLHQLGDFGFAADVPHVIDTARRHYPVMSQYLNFLHDEPTDPITRLVTLANLVEAFDRSLYPDPAPTELHREHARRAARLVAADPDLSRYTDWVKRAVRDSGRPTLASRLSRLDAECGGLVSESFDMPKWADAIAGVRNAVIHGLPAAEFFSRDRRPLTICADLLLLIFEERLLVAFGLDQPEVRKVLTENDPRWWERVHRIRSQLDSLREFEAFRLRGGPGPT